ncbi:portal protein [Plectonema phage Pbo-yong3]|uniref:portal protein n=1 Tax=Plectonema phage Pbo-yong3 TaxID=2970324 RepID=UPI00403C13D2|nr:portal protein [Plectonema phage Pbo-yong3]
MTIEMPTPLIESKEAAKAKLNTDRVGEVIIRKFEDTRTRRQTVETQWDETYELYRASATDLQNSRARSFQTTGASEDWHHRINTGHCFEVVETLVAYFKGATFPSDDWFDLKGMVPELADAARVVKQLTKTKLEAASIRDLFETWVRNLILAGVSTYRLGWDVSMERVFTRKFKASMDDVVSGMWEDVAKNQQRSQLTIEPLSPYDVWLDTSGGKNAGTFVRLRHTKEELHDLATSGYYKLDSMAVDRYVDYRFANPDEERTTKENDNSGYDIIEYYGPLLVEGVQFWCVHAVFYGKQLIRLSDSQYWCGSPFITATLLPDRDSVYGMSVLHPNLGALHTLNVLTNGRLDNLILHINKMWTMVEDGILKREDVKAKPGAVFKVAQHGSLQPIDMGGQDFMVTYQEAQVQESSVYRNTSTGPLIGNAAPRGGERVTAAEIQGVRDAGGNRLSSVHTHIEDAATLPLLAKVFTLLQQYYITPETVRLYSPEMQMDAFFQVEPEYLHYPYKFLALGANYVVERERMVTDLLQLLDISGRVPQIGERLEYEKILEDLLRQMRFTDPMRYIKPAAPEAPAMPPASPPTPGTLPPELEQSLGGGMMQQAIGQMTSEDIGEMAQVQGIDTSAISPEAMEMATQQITNGAL